MTFTREELQRQFDLYTAQIAELDAEIARESLDTNRQSLMARRFNLSKEREGIASDLAIQQKQEQPHNAPLEHRVTKLERDVLRLWSILKPGPRSLVARIVFYGLLFGLWSLWMVKEIRDWFLLHPGQAIVITLAMVVAALIIRWLPEDDNHD